MCSKAREFALALAILECAIKPVAMLPIWKDSLGHTRYANLHIYSAHHTCCYRFTNTNKLSFTKKFKYLEELKQAFSARTWGGCASS